jgi:uncharacterized damage-inducible protein DinB
MSISEKLLPELDEEFAVTRKFLELIPDDKLTWKPHAKSMELGRLAWHLADFPEWCRDIITKDFLKLSEQDGVELMQGWEGKKRADTLAKFDRGIPETRIALKKASDATLDHHWKMEWAGQIVVDSPRDQAIRKWVLRHMVHHRAQLGVYFRLNGIPVLGAYGPSADEMGA